MLNRGSKKRNKTNEKAIPIAGLEWKKGRLNPWVDNTRTISEKIQVKGIGNPQNASSSRTFGAEQENGAGTEILSKVQGPLIARENKFKKAMRQ